MQEEEVADVKWVTFDSLKEMIKNEETPRSLAMYFGFLEKLINQNN